MGDPIPTPTPLFPEHKKHHKKQMLIKINRKLNTQLALTLKFMDQSPVIEKVSRMKPEELNGLPSEEREKLKNAVLEAINSAKKKATQIFKEVEPDESEKME